MLKCTVPAGIRGRIWVFLGLEMLHQPKVHRSGSSTDGGGCLLIGWALGVISTCGAAWAAGKITSNLTRVFRIDVVSVLFPRFVLNVTVVSYLSRMRHSPFPWIVTPVGCFLHLESRCHLKTSVRRGKIQLLSIIYCFERYLFVVPVILLALDWGVEDAS